MVHKIETRKKHLYIATLRHEKTGRLLKIPVTAGDITKVKDKFVIETYDPEYVLIEVELKE